MQHLQICASRSHQDAYRHRLWIARTTVADMPLVRIAGGAKGSVLTAWRLMRCNPIGEWQGRHFTAVLQQQQPPPYLHASSSAPCAVQFIHLGVSPDARAAAERHAFVCLDLWQQHQSYAASQQCSGIPLHPCNRGARRFRQHCHDLAAAVSLHKCTHWIIATHNLHSERHGPTCSNGYVYPNAPSPPPSPSPRSSHTHSHTTFHCCCRRQGL